MKTEQEIVLQKKMIIIFSLIILTITMGILNIQKKNTMIAIESNEEQINIAEITKIYNNYTASEELFKIEISGDANSGETEALEDVFSGDTSENEQNEEEIKLQELKKQENKISNQETKESETSTVVASRGSYVRDTSTPPTEYERVIQVKATAYCLCKKCCGKTPDNPRYGYTASGLRIVPGTNMKVIAVDTSLVSLGTKVYVEGLYGAGNYGYAVAADTGSAIKNNKIDLYMDTHEQALAWGVKNVNLYILGE